MHLRDLERLVLKPMAAAVPGADTSSVFAGYREFVHLAVMALDLERQLEQERAREGFDEMDPQQVGARDLRDGRRAALHKAALNAGSSVMEHLVFEARGRPPKEKTTVGVLVGASGSPHPQAFAMEPPVLLDAYRLYFFRNNFLYHPTIHRVNARIRRRDGSYRLVAIPLRPPPYDENALAELRTQFSSNPAVASAPSDWDASAVLFDVVPLHCDGHWNPQRELIDTVTRRRGAQSMTVQEAVLALDRFLIELTRTAPFHPLGMNRFANRSPPPA